MILTAIETSSQIQKASNERPDGSQVTSKNTDLSPSTNTDCY